MSPATRKAPAASRGLRTQRDIRRSAPIFAALGDDVRLTLISRLCSQGPQSTTRLSEGASVTRQAITKHLEVLSAAGVVHSSRHGRERVWEVDSAPLHDAQAWLDTISRDWDRALSRLKAFVEK